MNLAGAGRMGGGQLVVDQRHGEEAKGVGLHVRIGLLDVGGLPSGATVMAYLPLASALLRVGVGVGQGVVAEATRLVQFLELGHAPAA